MPLFLVPVIITPIAVALLVWADYKLDKKYLVGFKLAASVLFIATILLAHAASPVNQTYFLLILTALCFSLIGDIFLALPVKYLAPGIAMFLIAQLLYLTTFAVSFHQGVFAILPAMLLLPLSYVYFNQLKPHLKNLKIPVMVYIAIINLMVICSAASLADHTVSTAKAALVVTGTLSFFLSDMFVAWDRFVKPFRIRYFEYIPYYLAQQLLALSVMYS